jgi:hypothetical protein
MDGLIVGMDMITRHCGTKKYKRRIFLITDGERETKYSANELKTIVANMNQYETRLNVISLDFCNELAEDEDEDDEDDQVDKKPKQDPNETKNQRVPYGIN